MAVQRRMQTSVAASRGAAARKTPPPRRTEEIGRGYVSSEVKIRKDVVHAEDQEVEVLREVFEQNEHPAFVKVGAGMTINLGNFESLRVDCSVTLPCHPENIQQAYETASSFVADRITDEQTAWLGEGNSKGKKR